MTQSAVCFNCQRGETEVPITTWRYQGSNIWVCSQCLPLLIHKLDQVIDVLRVAREQEVRGGEDG